MPLPLLTNVPSLAVIPVQETITSSPVNLNVLENGSITFSAASLIAGATDNYGNPLAASNITGITATNGTLIDNHNGTYTYTPAHDSTAPVALQFTVTDIDTGLAVQQNLNINITPVQETISSSPVSLNVLENGSVTFNISTLIAGATDNFGNPLAASNITGITASNGTLVDNHNGTYTYIPAHDSTAPVSLQFTVTDVDTGFAVQQNLNISITPVQEVISSNPVNLTVLENGNITFSASDLIAGATDNFGNPLAASNITGITASNGTLVDNHNGTYTYSPAHDSTAPVALHFTVTDVDTGLAVQQNLNISITPVQEVISSSPVNLNVLENGSLTFSAVSLIAGATDNFGNPLAASNITGITASNGSLVDNHNGTYTYTPAHDSTDPVSLQFTVTDVDTDLAVQQNLNISITPVQEVISSSPVNLNVLENGSLTFSAASLIAGATDNFGNPLAASNITGITASNGSLVDNHNGTYTYTPAHDSTAPVYLHFTVTDVDTGLAVQQNLNISITPVQETISSNPVNLNVLENGSVTFSAASLLAGATDNFGNPLAVGSITGITSSNGAIVDNHNGTYTYTPAHNSTDPVHLQFTISDTDTSLTVTQNLNISITPVTETITSVPASLSVLENGSVTFSAASLLTGDSDSLGNQLVASNITGITSTNGTLIDNHELANMYKYRYGYRLMCHWKQ